MVDALAHARDVLRMIAIGIQQHHIQARDVEFLYADGPKRVSVHRLAVEAMQGLEREIAARPAGVAPAAPTDEEVAAWADSFIREHAYNRPVAVQIAVEAAKWVRSRIAGVRDTAGGSANG